MVARRPVGRTCRSHTVSSLARAAHHEPWRFRSRNRRRIHPAIGRKRHSPAGIGGRPRPADLRNPSLRLIVLNACESAFSSTEGIFTSTAAKLVREGVPAVVAMQYEITDDSGAGVRLRLLRADRPGRIRRPRDDTRAGGGKMKMTHGSLEWATPVLFLSSEETRIFEVPEQAHCAPNAETTAGTPT